MKVAFVGAHARVGRPHGATSQLAGLAGALAACGHDVTVYTCHPNAELAECVPVDAGYLVVYVPAGAPPDAMPDTIDDAALAPLMGDFARGLTEAWADERPDVVSADSWIYGIAAQLAADRLGVPTVQSFSQLSAVVKRRQLRELGPVARPRFERLLARSATRVTASCSEDVLELIRLGCPRSRTSVLPRGIDVESFSPVGAAVERGDRPRIVAMASDLLPHRGFDDLIEAVPTLADAEVVIVGGPPRRLLDQDPDAERLLRLAKAHGAQGRVHLTGAVRPEHVPHVLRSADVFACPAWYEPFGLPVVEAMACGVPVVASEAGGMADTVIAEVTGLLVPPRNPKLLAAALNEVLHAGPLGSGMGAAGRTRARACYGWERVATDAETIYQRAIDTYRVPVGHAAAAPHPS